MYQLRGNGVFEKSIRALQLLNALGCGRDENLALQLTYNPLLERRELLTVTPRVIYKPNEPFNLEAAILFTLGGQDFPDGVQFTDAISCAFSFL